MYESFYGFTEKPFSLAPDPRYFFESTGHKRGLAYLHYGLHQGQGFIVVTGMPGTGKSTLVHNLLHSIPSGKNVIATINNTNIDEDSILQIVANSFGIYQVGDGKAATLSKLERYFNQQHHKGKHVILLVDEAQNLPTKSLEELRMLSNFQQGNQMLVQIMLVGQKQLQAILADKEMEQLTQRVIASYHLEPMSMEETYGYIRHRLLRAGWKGRPSFTGDALTLIFGLTLGVPRLINVFCDRLLLYGYLEEKMEIKKEDVSAVAEELEREAAGNWINTDVEERDETLSSLPLPGEEFEEPRQEKVESFDVKEDQRLDTPDIDTFSVNSSPLEKETFDFPNRDREPAQIAAADEPYGQVDSVRVIGERASRPEPEKNNAMVYLVVVLLIGVMLIAGGLYMDFMKKPAPETVENHGSNSLPNEKAIINEPVSDVVPVAETEILEPPPAAVAEPEEVVPQQAPQLQPQPVQQSSADVSVEPEVQKPEVKTVKAQPPVVAKKPVVRGDDWDRLVSDIRGTDSQQAEVSDIEVATVMNDLIMSYQEGSLKQLIGLFDHNAVDGSFRGRSAIAKKYEKLFQATDMRQMDVAGIRWESDGRAVYGEGEYQISSWPRGELVPEEQTGKLKIEAVKQGEHLLIKKLSYSEAE